MTNGVTTLAVALVAVDRAPEPAVKDAAGRMSSTSPAATLDTDVVHTRLVIVRSTWARVQPPWAEEPPPKEQAPTELKYMYGSVIVMIVCVGMWCAE